jgi:hypothetical protein
VGIQVKPPPGAGPARIHNAVQPQIPGQGRTGLLAWIQVTNQVAASLLSYQQEEASDGHSGRRTRIPATHTRTSHASATSFPPARGSDYPHEHPAHAPQAEGRPQWGGKEARFRQMGRGVAAAGGGGVYGDGNYPPRAGIMSIPARLPTWAEPPPRLRRRHLIRKLPSA